MSNYGRFGALLGTIAIGNSHCKFLVRWVKKRFLVYIIKHIIEYAIYDY